MRTHSLSTHRLRQLILALGSSGSSRQSRQCRRRNLQTPLSHRQRRGYGADRAGRALDPRARSCVPFGPPQPAAQHVQSSHERWRVLTFTLIGAVAPSADTHGILPTSLASIRAYSPGVTPPWAFVRYPSRAAHAPHTGAHPRAARRRRRPARITRAEARSRHRP